MAGFYEASLKGDYDPETFIKYLPTELQELFGGSGLTFSIGEQTITFLSDGSSYVFESEEEVSEANEFIATHFGEGFINGESGEWKELTSEQRVFLQKQNEISVSESSEYSYTVNGKTINLGTTDAETAARTIQTIDELGIESPVVKQLASDMEGGTETTVSGVKVVNVKTGLKAMVEATVDEQGNKTFTINPKDGTGPFEGSTYEEALLDWAESLAENENISLADAKVKVGYYV